MQQNGLDRDGFILSEVDSKNILPEYNEAIEDSLTEIKRALPDMVHSAYVYGSVARGNAVMGKSDLDLLLVLNRELVAHERNELNGTLARLSDRYRALVREVGVADCTLEGMLDPANEFGWGAYLKILCICVYGDDLTQRFNSFKLTPRIALGFNGDVGESIKAAIQKIEHADTDEEASKIAATLARKLIRSCYSMVMSRAQIWTTKLEEQARVFTQIFPEKREFVETLRSWIVTPPTNRDGVLTVLRTDGEWLTENFEKEAVMLTA